MIEEGRLRNRRRNDRNLALYSQHEFDKSIKRVAHCLTIKKENLHLGRRGACCR